MKLYASAASSFARKIRVLLLEKGVQHELEMVNLWEENALKKANPLGKVPALALDDGRVLPGSPLIADYVDTTFPEPRFIPADHAARFEVRRWEALADGVMDAVAATLYEKRFHDEKTRSDAWLARQRSKYEAGLGALEAMLGGRTWCVGESMTLADVAIGCHLGFINLRVPEVCPKEKYPALTRLWSTLETRDSFVKTAPPRT